MITSSGILGCCAIRGLGGFDGLEENMRKQILDHQSQAIGEGKSILFASINNNQTVANKLLKELGFTPSPWATRPKKHSTYQTKVRMFYKLLADSEGKSIPRRSTKC